MRSSGRDPDWAEQRRQADGQAQGGTTPGARSGSRSKLVVRVAPAELTIAAKKVGAKVLLTAKLAVGGDAGAREPDHLRQVSAEGRPGDGPSRSRFGAKVVWAQW